MVGLIELRLLKGLGEVKRVFVTNMFDKQWVGSTFSVDKLRMGISHISKTCFCLLPHRHRK
jgi:hypothetical protein